MRTITMLCLSFLLTLCLIGCNEQTPAQPPQSAVTESDATTRPQNIDDSAAQNTPAIAAKAVGTETPQPQVEQDKTRAQIALTNPASDKTNIIAKGEGIMLQGTVRYMNLEGGFWGIVADNGQKILPKNLPAEYRKDGLRLSFSAQEITGMMTIQQWGTLSSLSEISVIGQVDSQSSDPRL
ncbi:hypothetical protein [Shewanella sp. KJ2020]|uniref:hypothetical protein n=1 Tax=Shewanella sp. KJ2020 TaxID=2919172 RepID=UPI0020A70BB6|nr:hypothetical protein [Shewanella sp. KJ2020]MCP3128406.1 hypothetical protein [Shewanella sp. KJ2020]